MASLIPKKKLGFLVSFHYPGFVRNLDFSVSTQGAYNDICTKEFSGEPLDLSLFF